MVITINDYRAKSRNQTTRQHWIHYRNQKIAFVSLLMTSLPDSLSLFTKPATVSISAYYKGKRHVDTSNLDDKIIVDGLIEVGILKDDRAFENPRVIKTVYPESGVDKVVIEVVAHDK